MTPNFKNDKVLFFYSVLYISTVLNEYQLKVWPNFIEPLEFNKTVKVKASYRLNNQTLFFNCVFFASKLLAMIFAVCTQQHVTERYI